MSALDAIAGRLRRSDMIQVLAVGLLALAFVVAVRWPTGSAEVNEVWFVMAPARAVLLAVASLVFGALWGIGGGADEPVRPDGTPVPSSLEPAEGRATLGALLVVALLTWPFEIAGHAASYPDANFALSALAPFLVVGAFFAIGAWVGAGARRSGLLFLAPLASIAVVGAAIWFESVSGVNLINPARGVLEGSASFLTVGGALTLSLAPLLLRRSAG